MCNPDESKRPSIFDVEDELRKGFDARELILSSSPDSICLYSELFKNPDSVKFSYDDRCFVSPARPYLMSLLKEKSKEHSSLIIMIYSYLTSSPSIDNDLYQICTIISNSLIGAPLLQYGVTNVQIEKLKYCLNERKFEFFNWKDYFDVSG